MKESQEELIIITFNCQSIDAVFKDNERLGEWSKSEPVKTIIHPALCLWCRSIFTWRIVRATRHLTNAHSKVMRGNQSGEFLFKVLKHHVDNISNWNSPQNLDDKSSSKTFYWRDRLKEHKFHRMQTYLVRIIQPNATKLQSSTMLNWMQNIHRQIKQNIRKGGGHCQSD